MFILGLLFAIGLFLGWETIKKEIGKHTLLGETFNFYELDNLNIINVLKKAFGDYSLYQENEKLKKLQRDTYNYLKTSNFFEDNKIKIEEDPTHITSEKIEVEEIEVEVNREKRHKININGKETIIVGNSIDIRDDGIYVDSKKIEGDFADENRIVIEADDANLKSMFPVYVKGSLQDVTCEGNVEAISINGDVIKAKEVTAKDIFGNVKSSGDVNCIEIGGDVESKSIKCDKIEGDVNSKTSITCGDIEGDVETKTLNANDINGDIKSETLKCNDINSDNIDSTNITCNDIKGGDLNYIKNLVAKNIDCNDIDVETMRANNVDSDSIDATNIDCFLINDSEVSVQNIAIKKAAK